MDDIASEDQEELEVLAELVDIMGPGTETSTMGKSGMHEIQVKMELLFLIKFIFPLMFRILKCWTVMWYYCPKFNGLSGKR